jgi:hypothetical protein
MPSLSVAVGAVGVSHQLQMGEQPPESGWVQVAGRLDQHRLRLFGDVLREVVGAVGQRAGMRRGNLAVAQGLGRPGQGAGEQGPGGPHHAGGGGGAHVEAVAQPAGSRGCRGTLVGSGRPVGVDLGEFVEPVPFELVQQPPQDQDPLGSGCGGQPGSVLAGEGVDVGGQRRQPVRWTPRRLAAVLVRTPVRIHGGNLSGPHPNASTEPNLRTTIFR